MINGIIFPWTGFRSIELKNMKSFSGCKPLIRGSHIEQYREEASQKYQASTICPTEIHHIFSALRFLFIIGVVIWRFAIALTITRSASQKHSIPGRGFHRHSINSFLNFYPSAACDHKTYKSNEWQTFGYVIKWRTCYNNLLWHVNRFSMVINNLEW